MILLFVISNDQKNYVMLYCTMIVQDSTLVRTEYSLDENYSVVIDFKERNIHFSEPLLFILNERCITSYVSSLLCCNCCIKLHFNYKLLCFSLFFNLVWTKHWKTYFVD